MILEASDLTEDFLPTVVTVLAVLGSQIAHRVARVSGLAAKSRLRFERKGAPRFSLAQTCGFQIQKLDFQET